MVQDRGTLTTLRRDVLVRIADNGPLDRDDALQGSFNCIPALRRLGWIKSKWGVKPHVCYEITEDGLMTIGRRQQAISVQDPSLLLESLIVLGRSHDGAVERDLRAAVLRLVTENEQKRKALDWIASSSLDEWAVGVAMEILGHGPRDRSLDPPAQNNADKRGPLE